MKITDKQRLDFLEVNKLIVEPKETGGFYVINREKDLLSPWRKEMNTYISKGNDIREAIDEAIRMTLNLRRL